MQGVDEVIDEITTIVDWYKSLPKDYSNIVDLMYARQKICGNMFMLATELGKARQCWKEQEFTTESIRRKSMVEMLDNGMAIGKAAEYSKADSLLSLEMEKGSESFYHLLKFLIDSTQEVNNTIMQHISTLKREKESSPQYT